MSSFRRYDTNSYGYSSGSFGSKPVLSKISEFGNSILYTLKHTSAEIIIGALIGCASVGIISYNHESDKNKMYRIGFSEIHDLEKTASNYDKTLPNMTEFLAKTNDFYMKILEANNDSWKNSFLENNNIQFAKELEIHTEITLKQHYYELPQLKEEIPKLGDSLILDLKDVVEMKKHLDGTLITLNKTWDEDHDDEYHTEIYMEEETHTDSDGKQHSEMVMKTRQVYDYTDNTYDYHSPYGNESAVLLDQFRDTFSKISLDTLFVVAKKTGAENEWAIEKSHKYDYKDNKFPAENYLQIANSWAKGSMTHKSLEKLVNLQDALIYDANAWDSQKNTAKSYAIRTYDHSYGRSKEVLTIIDAESNAENFSLVVDNMLETIHYTQKNVPDLTTKINNYISATLDGKEKNSRKIKNMKKEIILETIEGYNKLFPEAIKVERSEWGHVWLWVLAGLVVGGALGAGVDYLADKNKFYDKYLKK